MQVLLIGSLFHLLTYPRGLYYGSPHFFGRATSPYYSSAGYRSHYAAPSTVGGRTVHSAASAGRPSMASSAAAKPHTPVAQARPVGGTPSSSSYTRQPSHYTATSSHSSTPVARARPASSSSHWHGSSRRGRG
eukprot:1439131-Prymnesium_polylepis.1